MTGDGYYGKYKGFVRLNNDPERRNRIRCYCPQVMGRQDSIDKWLGWAEPNSPWLGGLNLGDSGAPFTRDQQIASSAMREYFGVWIEFEQGQLDFPIWCGTFTIAPDPDDPFAQEPDASTQEGVPGGGIIGGAVPTGTELDPLNPPKPINDREIRLLAPVGVDLIIQTAGGGTVIVGSSGVHITGIQVTLNGKPISASITDVSNG